MISDAADAAMGALAQQSRLELFRLLMQRGPEGVAAGEIAEALDIAPPTLSFHLAQLRHAGLISVRRDGRSLSYTADYQTIGELIAFLTEHRCAANPSARPRTSKKGALAHVAV